ncbi:MAG: flagellar basal body rod protein FlgC [Aestuariivita sp.]|nr:flagellar basal body rod protein FlgC [Aestuariivita sp.]|tara:strand:+ start:112 stop:528 length:417 start_codon:yes stop_codon:yes gene_type:complete
MAEVKNIFDVVGRSLGAQMVRLNAVASNLANMESKSGSAETAFKPVRPIFETVFSENYGKNGIASVDAVEVIPLDRKPELIYEPGHPNADAQGYVYKAPVNSDEEMVDMLEASRQYQNNLEVISTVRTLMMRTINMGK